MKKKSLLNLSLLAFLIYPLVSQEFDESFLESLPSDIRTDLLNEISLREQVEEPQYKRDSTFIKKDMSQINSLRFGVNYFSMMQSTLMPLNEPNFDGNYILDYGDVIELQLIGQKVASYKLEINRDGTIGIPELGKVSISGLSLSDVSDLIKLKIENSYIGVEAFVSLTEIRDIQIIVSGNVFNPGPYTLNGNSNIFHALTVSGGPSQDGSFREISLVRNGNLIETIDLYDTFVKGLPSFGERLRSGDIVFVRPSMNLVSVYGGIKRPGIYELKDDENLNDVIQFANGFSKDADLDDIKLDRIIEGQIKSIKINTGDDLNNFEPNDGDVLLVRKFPFRNVSIRGAVRNPGEYILTEGDGIFDLVKRAGGYTKNAYALGGILENQQTREINQEAIERLYTNFIKNLAKNYLSSQNEISSGILSLFTEIREQEVNGRVVAEFNLDILQENPSKDIFLQDGDKVFIPEIMDHVFVFGQISTQGTSKYEENADASFYINQQGGYLEDADKKNIFVMLPNGETKKIDVKNIFANRPNNFEIYPGSIIYVPEKINDVVFTNTLQAYATILGNFGVSLASISVLKD